MTTDEDIIQAASDVYIDLGAPANVSDLPHAADCDLPNWPCTCLRRLISAVEDAGTPEATDD